MRIRDFALLAPLTLMAPRVTIAFGVLMTGDRLGGLAPGAGRSHFIAQKQNLVAAHLPVAQYHISLIGIDMKEPGDVAEAVRYRS